MMGKTHLLGGIAAGCVAAAACPDLSTKGVAVAAGAVGGLIPDIDHKNSILSKKVPVISWIVRLFSGHRGLFHCPLFYILIATGIYSFLLPEMEWIKCGFYGLFAGIFSHLLLDACTVHGIPMFFPFSRKNIHLLPLRTNSGGEMVIRTGLLCLSIGILWVCR